MSFLTLRVPPHARKVWKSLTSTIAKLHKIRKSKAMKSKKQIRRKHNVAMKPPPNPKSLLSNSNYGRRRFRCKRIAAVKSVLYGFYKKPSAAAAAAAPVYIDKLFKEPSSSSSTTDFVGYLKKPQQVEQPRTDDQKIVKRRSKEEEGTSGDRWASSSTSDDMWEAVALGSPGMMQGIDERAEEFITRFRLQMAAQDSNLPRNREFCSTY